MDIFEQSEQPAALHHGGRLRAAAARYAIPLESWLDLSTGINVNGWPVRTPPASTWVRLPEEEDELNASACRYYGAEAVLPVAGSQAAIQALPQLRAASYVSVLNPGYAEHAHAWQRNRHTVTAVTPAQIDAALATSDVLVIIHPNNPTGDVFSTAQLLAWHAELAERGGWLIVDEAFMDATPESSLAPHAWMPGLIVLRSLGKFFGLAGARVGFVCAHPQLLTRLNHLLGPWTVNAPARWMAIAALQDDAWHERIRQRLLQDSRRLQALLCRHGLVPTGGSAFFQWIRTDRAAEIFAGLASQGILTRLFNQPDSLRLGLPGSESEWQRLASALAML